MDRTLASPGGHRNMMRAFRTAPWLGPLAALVATFLLFALVGHETFATTGNVITMVRQTAVVGIATVGMTLIIVLGGIDLSVGSVVALTSVVIASSLKGGH